MSELEEEPKATPESKKVLLQRIIWVVFLQYLLAFIAAVVVDNASALSLALQDNLWSLFLCLGFAEALMIASYFMHPRKLRGYVGIAMVSVFSLLVMVIFGGFLPALLPSVVLGLGMMLVVCFGGLIYILCFYPEKLNGTQVEPGDFKAHVVVPVGLLLSLLLYGLLLSVFHTSTTAQLMIWTFLEAVFIIYFNLILEDIYNEPSLGMEDWCLGSMKVYSESLILLISYFQTKSVAKGK